MLIKEIMSQQVTCMSPSDSLRQAAEKMKELDVGYLPVCGEDQKLAGVLTDRDIVIRAIAEGKDPSSWQVKDAMTPELICCYDDQSTDEAAEQMKDRQVRRIIVLNREHQLVGIVSLGDLATKCVDFVGGDTLERVSEPSYA